MAKSTISDLNSDALPVQLERALDILECLTYAGQPRSLGEIASKVAIPKATAHRLLSAFVTRGYAIQDARSGQYMAGLRCFELGSVWINSLDLRRVALPHLQYLNEISRETVHLAVYDRGDAVYIEKLESTQPVVVKSFVGRRCAAFCVAAGRALLAHQPASEIDHVLASSLPRFTSNTIVEPKALRDLLSKIRTDGFAVNHGCFRDGVGGIAVPVRDHTGGAVASVGLCLPEQRFGSDRLVELRNETFLAAQSISTQLGFSGQLVGLTSEFPTDANLPKRMDPGSASISRN